MHPLADVLLTTPYVAHYLIMITSSLEDVDVLRVLPISSSSILTVESNMYEKFNMSHATVLGIRIPSKLMDL